MYDKPRISECIRASQRRNRQAPGVLMDYFVIAGLGLIGAALTFLGIRRRNEKVESERINAVFNARAAETLRGAIHDTLEAGVGGIDRDLEGDDPAGDLANRGNVRSRRAKK